MVRAIESKGQGFYDLNTIQTIRVYMSQGNWDQLLDAAYASTGDYIMADSVSINGITFDSVGVKYKGNSSYNASQVKNPWHIELDTYKEQEYQGYKDIKLANVYKDPSFLRDVLGYQIVRQYMDAPKANYANLYVNGTLIGLYSNTEAISKTFVKDRFGSKSNPFFNCSPPAGASPMGMDFPNLVYLGDDSVAYYDAYEMKSDAGWQHLIQLCDTLANNIQAIEKVLDVDRALWMLAFDNVIVNLDSYIGQFSQNYYLYQDDYGRFLPVVWDLNESFGTFSFTGTTILSNTTSKQQMSHLLHSSEADFPLISQLLAVPTFKRMYLAHLKTILTEQFANIGAYYSEAQSLRTLIDDAVQADPNKFFSYDQFLSNLDSDVSAGAGPGGGIIPGIANLMNPRATYLLAQADFVASQPQIMDVKVSDSMPAVGTTVTITTFVTDEENVFLGYRSQNHAPFHKVQMYDDGNHQDGAANDGIFGASINLLSLQTHYFIYAENTEIGRFSPARAQHEFYVLTAISGITPGDIVINEFMASNDATVVDQDGEHDDWIELYNNSEEPVDLSGYGLSDDLSDLTVFTFPSGTVLQPDMYLVVWADGDVDQSGYHADFKISAGGETIYLTDENQLVIDSIAFGSQETDQTYGRYPNGTGPFQELTPTFGYENSPGTTATKFPLSDIQFSIYPNPTNNYCVVELPERSFDMQTLEVYNVAGIKIYQTDFQDVDIINTLDWPEGLYLVRIGKQTQKLLIAR